MRVTRRAGAEDGAAVDTPGTRRLSGPFLADGGEKSQLCACFAEENQLGWCLSSYLFPQFQFGAVGFSACVNQKMYRPVACTYLMFLLHV